MFENCLLRDVAIADGTGPELIREHAVLVVDGVIKYLGSDADSPPLPQGCRIIDCGGAVMVPGMVDAHSHLTLPGGSHWIARIDDPTDELLRVSEANGEMAVAAGTRWFRDVGSPRRDGRALALRVRDTWRGRRDRPYIRAAGTWLSKAGVLPPSVAVEVSDGDDLAAAVQQQIIDGADLVKLYLDGPDADSAPWTASEIARAADIAHEAGIKVTAHATGLSGARAGVDAGIDCVEHATRLDADLVEKMAIRGTFIVPTVGVLASWETFASTTEIDRFTGHMGRGALEERKRDATESIRLARAAGVPIAAGTDFGGGSLRANQMPWEVECLVAAGLEPWEALGAATWRGGELLGEAHAGRIVVGGPADFFLIHGNPLEDPSALWRIWRP